MAAAVEPPRRRGVMSPASEDVRSRGLFSVDPRALEEVDLNAELRRFLWCAAAVLALVLYLAHVVDH